MAQKSSAPLEKQVRSAMKSLADAGKPITNESVRQAIGGGSFRDIGPLVKSIKAYKSGARNDPVMKPMVAALSDEDTANLAAYYSTLNCK